MRHADLRNTPASSVRRSSNCWFVRAQNWSASSAGALSSSGSCRFLRSSLNPRTARHGRSQVARSKLGGEKAAAQREYELKHND
jgi:hypothetical protein